MQKADYIRRLPVWGTWLLLLGFVLAGVWLQTRLRIGALLLAILLIAVYAALAWILYDRLRWWLPMAMPVGVTLAAALLRLALPDESELKRAVAD
jgi:hypothetical protein